MADTTADATLIVAAAAVPELRRIGGARRSRGPVVASVVAGILLVVTILLVVSPSIVAHSSSSSSQPGSAVGMAYINAIVLGDWGRYGGQGQVDVAQAMASYAGRVKTWLVMTTGDNFYENGVVSTSDSHWTLSWANVYLVYASLRVPWYPTWGNHDKYGNFQAQLDWTRVDPNNLWSMPAANYSYKLAVPGGSGAGCVYVVAIDTELISYKQPSRAVVAGHLAWIDSELARAQVCQWRVVVGHRPPYDPEQDDTGPLVSALHTSMNLPTRWNARAGRRVDDCLLSDVCCCCHSCCCASAASVALVAADTTTGSLQQLLLQLLLRPPLYSRHCRAAQVHQLVPLLIARGVTCYCAGHVHGLEYIYRDGVHYVTSGGGSKLDPDSELSPLPPPHQGLRFWAKARGFAGLTFGPTLGTIEYVGNATGPYQSIYWGTMLPSPVTHA